VGWLAVRALRAQHPGSPGVVLATAHPAKFPAAVERAIGRGMEAPAALREPMARPETITSLPADYADFRRFLLGR
jgi:threonine synthase